MAQTLAKKDSQTIQLPYLPEKARITTFENGYRLVFVPKRGDVFNVSTWVKTGSINEDDQNNGISHFLEHLLFKGTERFAPGEFDKKMESMGAVINAATWKDFTFYYVTGPKNATGEGLGENFQTALDMHADMMLFSTIPDAEVGPQYDPFDPDYRGEKRERSVVIEEIGMREDQPWTKVYNAVNHMMYADGHPYQRDVIGTRQIIGTIPRERILEYYHRWYSPDHLTTIVVGDFDYDALEAEVLQRFDFSRQHPMAANGKPDSYHTAPGNGARYQEVIGEYQTSFVIIGYHGPRPSQLEDTIALDIFNQALSESRNSRLTQALIEKPAKPVFSYVGAGQSTYGLGNVYYIQGNYMGVTPKDALGLIHAEVNRMLNEAPLTQEEFTHAVKKLRVNFAETSETASGIAETIGESLTVVGDLSQYVGYLDALNTMTPEKVQAVARQYLSPDKAYTAVLVPSEEARQAAAAEA